MLVPIPCFGVPAYAEGAPSAAKAGAAGAFVCALPELLKCSPAGAASLCQGSGRFASVWEPVSRCDQSLLKVNPRDEEWRSAQKTRLPCRARSDREKSHFTGGNFPQRPLCPLALRGPKASGLSGEPRIQPGALWPLHCA